jgi:hypothetical protein
MRELCIAGGGDGVVFDARAAGDEADHERWRAAVRAGEFVCAGAALMYLVSGIKR